MSCCSSTLVALLLACTAFGQYPSTQRILVHGATSLVQVKDIEQDALGSIWFGTGSGLMRYNGDRTTLVNADQPNVLALSSSTGYVIAALSNGLVLKCQGLSIDTLLSDTNLIHEDTRSILLDREHRIWSAQYGKGVQVIVGARREFFSTDNGLLDDHIRDMVALDDGRVAVATDQGVALISLNNDEPPVTIAQGDGLPDDLVTALEVEGDTLWVSMQREGICWIDLRSSEVNRIPCMVDWPFGMITALAIRGDVLWAGTRRHGAIRLILGDSLGYNLPINTEHIGSVADMLLDEDGALWTCMGTDQVLRSETNVQLITYHEGMSMEGLAAICSAKDGSFYAARGKQLFKHPRVFNNLNTMRSITASPLSADIVSLHEDEQGTLWVGTFGAGVMTIGSDETRRHYTTAQGLCDDHVLGISSRGNEVWLATLGGVCKITIHDGAELIFQHVEIPGSGFIYDILITQSGSAYAATDGAGVIRIEPDGEVTQLLADREQRTFYSLVAGDGDEVWALGPGTGFCRISSTGQTCFGGGNSAFEDVFGVQYCKGIVVAITAQGLMTFDPGSQRIAQPTGSIQVGQLSAELNSSFVDAEERFWIATDQGLYNIGATSSQLSGTVPSFITGVSSGGGALKSDELLSIPSDRNFITFHFNGRAYSAPNTLRFSYQLQGFDHTVLTTRDRSVSYSQLPPGEYTFTVESLFGDNAPIGAQASVQVRILKPVWQRWWFLLAVAFTILFAAYFFLRAGKRKREKEELLERERMRFQFEALSSQVNPHFLFNSFNTLLELIEESKDKAIDHVHDLSNFFRSMLKVRDKDVITLQQDLEMLNTYVLLEQRRFGERIQVQQHVDRDQLQCLVAPLTAQLLVENAIKHTVFSDQQPLVVDLTAQSGYLTVTNPLRPKQASIDSTEYGLNSIRQRYSMLTPAPIHIDQGDGKFSVSIPLITAK